jgi:RNA polymerase sigma-70 factor (ECF subfamily)
MTDSEVELSQGLAAHREPVLRYIRGIVRDSATAEDLTQETLLKAHRKLSTLEDPAKLGTWLYRIATNLCHDRFRQAAYRNRPESLHAETDGSDEAVGAGDPADTAPRLDKVMEQQEMSSCVQRYLTGLSDPYRAVILLHDAEGMTNPEIAQLLGVSLATVKIRVHRAREKLRAALAEACTFSTDERGVVVCEPKPLQIEDASDSS